MAKSIDQLLEVGINRLHETFILWDSKDRLVLCNDRFREVNEAVADLLHPGTTYEAFLRAGVARGCYPEALGQEEQWISVRISQHRNPKGPVEVKREDGHWLLIDEQEMPDGGIVSIATDVTVQKAAEEALRASEIRFRQHASATSDWLWETDAERRYTYISDVMEDKLGRRVQQYLGTTVDTNIEDVYKRAEWQPFFDAFEARQPFRDLTVKRRDPDGTEQWIRTSGVPFFDVDGDFLGYRGSSSDVTEYVEAEQRLANLTTAINRKNEIVILYDADDRLVFCNDAFRDFNTDIADLIRPGVTFEELTRASLERGLITEALGREEDWLQQRLERHRNPEGPVELERHGGVWQLIQEQCLEDGSVVSIVLDITDRKRAEEALHDNERQLRLITDAVPAVIIYFDADLRFQFVNKTAESWYDRPAAELIGRTSAEVVGTKRAATASARLEAALAGAPQEYEARHTYPDGQIRDVNGTYVPHFNAAGHVVGIYTLVLDVTERKRAQDALRDSEQRFRTVFDHVPAAIALKDSQGRYELINKPYEEYFQNKAEAVLGKTSADFYPPEIAARLAENDRSVAKSKSVMTEDTKVTQPHLPMRHVRITKFPVFEQSGKVSGVGTIAINISAEKAAEERLIQSQKMEAVGQLTGGIAHEFNNLLQVVASYVGLLEEDLPLNAETKQAFDAINRNVTRGADLTDRLLSYSRQQPLAPRSLDVIDVLKEMQIMLRQTLGERIRVETAPLINIWPAEADPNQLENALLNLALNARDAMPDGGVIKLSAENIQLTAEDAAAREDTTPGDYVMLAVTDNGSGMTAESMNRAFEPFFSTKGVGKGTGLGLSMVYGFAKQSGGFVEIDSEVGQGTTMRLYLRRPIKTDNNDTSEAELPPRATSRNIGTILLVEDDNDVRASLAAQLTSMGYQVMEAKDGADALAAFVEAKHIDLLFTDVVMPGGLSGLDLARQLVALRPGLKILYTTGYSEDVVAETGQIQDGAFFLRKPYNKARLAATIAAILN